ncbi:MAG: thioredoxin family protein [Actinomycetota bacterium]
MGSNSTRMLELGTPLPEFSLPDADGKMHSSSDYDSAPGLLVMFVCNHCPYVQFIAEKLAEVTAEFLEKGLAVVGINSNAATDPDDAPEKMKDEIKSRGYKFPYLIDEDQSVAKTYMAQATPEFFLFDKDRKLVYHGQFDHARPRRNVPVTGEHLKEAVDQVLGGKPVPEKQIPGSGCGIVWETGKEPAYLTG